MIYKIGWLCIGISTKKKQASKKKQRPHEISAVEYIFVKVVTVYYCQQSDIQRFTETIVKNFVSRSFRVYQPRGSF